MKHVVSVSLGASSRDHRAEVELLGEQFTIERVGTDGKLDLDKPVRGLREFEELAEKYLPDACKLPFQFFYPTGKKQEQAPEPKYPQYYHDAEIIAGDFHFMRRFMPDRLEGKTILTNTVTAPASTRACAMPKRSSALTIKTFFPRNEMPRSSCRKATALRSSVFFSPLPSTAGVFFAAASRRKPSRSAKRLLPA